LKEFKGHDQKVTCMILTDHLITGS